MKGYKRVYCLIGAGLFLLAACNTTKNVPENRFLLTKNKIITKGDKLDSDDLNDIIRQHPNYKKLGIKWKLFAYNFVDSAKVADKRYDKNILLREKNKDLLKKEDRVNTKRIERAKRKGKSVYTHKTVVLKDTINPRKFIGEWYKYKIGQPPVVFDSIPFLKSVEQLNAYLKSTGYYYGKVQGLVDYRKHKKCYVKYLIETGNRYFIDSVYVLCKNQEVKETYDAFVSVQHDPPLIHQAFDADMLDSYRGDVSKFMRDSSFYGFSASSIRFIADTTRGNYKVSLGVEIGDRVVQLPEFKDSVIMTPYKKYSVASVYFHLADTVNYEGNFVEAIKKRGLTTHTGNFLNTLDTLYYNSGNFTEGKHVLDVREAYFLYNGKPYVRPRILEIHNYPDYGVRYRDKDVEATYTSLRRMDMFNEIKIDLKEDRENQTLVVNNYLVRGKKQNYSFEPRATNSNGFLGVSATVSYVNRNLFGGAERLKVGLSGGFESQPPVFETVGGEDVKTSERSFNTLEIGPLVEVQVPGFFPFRSSKIAKKRRPLTIISGAFNYQDRLEFKRRTLQINYNWKLYVSKTQAFQIGFPFVSSIKFINIQKEPEFESKLNALNDVFLLDAYSNQFVWQDWRLHYEYNIKDKPNRRRKTQIYYSITFDPAGNVLSLFRSFQDTTESGQYAINGVGYSQFIRADNELHLSQPLGKERSLNFRLSGGAGIPYGNSTNTLPYDYSFFAGGANDIRGWDARTLGPGKYAYYLDSNRTSTQLGNIKIVLSGELRFAINSFLKGAFFMDAGNIWTFSPDENRVGSEFTKLWYQQLMVGTGVGLRFDLEYFIIRLDVAIPLYNPALTATHRWYGENYQTYLNEILYYHGLDPANGDTIPASWNVPHPYLPRLHFGIGYPF